MIQRVLFLAFLLIAAPSFGQLPAARVTSVFPPGGKVGSTVDVAVTGVDLDGATELRFSQPGITAKSAGSASATEAKFTVTVAGDVPLGIHDCRVVGKFGISNPRAFIVGGRTEAADLKPATSADKATKLALDTVASARTTAGAFDHWLIEAKQGHRIIVEVATREVDSRLWPTLAVLDASGRELAQSRRSGLADFTAPADGAYTIRVSDLQYRGGAEFAYRLVASTGPRVDAIFPAVGKPGTKAKYTLLGRNLPGGKASAMKSADGRPLDELSVEIDLPASPRPGEQLAGSGLVGASGIALNGIAYRFKSDRGVSNPVAILYTDADVSLEAESAEPATARNDASTDAQRLTLPVTVAGRFHPRGDRDVFAFDAKKGESYMVEVIADRAGRPVATSLVLQRVSKDEKGEKLADVLESADDETNPGTPAFRTATRDPVLRWDVKDDGQYRLTLRDKFGVSSDDPTRGYTLVVRKPAPDFQPIVTALSAAASDVAVWSPILRKGGVAPVRVTLVRLDGHTGDVIVKPADLPKGVTCEPITLGGTESAGVLMFRATDDVAEWAGPVRIIATGKAGDADVTRDARYGAVVQGTAPNVAANNANNQVDPVVSRPVADLSLGVCAGEAEPLTIMATDDKVYEAMAGTKLSIPLTVKKSLELKQALKLKAIGVDGLKNVKEVTIDAKADKASLELDLAQTKLPAGVYTFCLASAAQVKYARPGGEADTSKDDKSKDKKKDAAKDLNLTVYSGPITIKVLPAEKPEKAKK